MECVCVCLEMAGGKQWARTRRVSRQCQYNVKLSPAAASPARYYRTTAAAVCDQTSSKQPIQPAGGQRPAPLGAQVGLGPQSWQEDFFGNTP